MMALQGISGAVGSSFLLWYVAIYLFKIKTLINYTKRLRRVVSLSLPMLAATLNLLFVELLKSIRAKDLSYQIFTAIHGSVKSNKKPKKA